jgi:hypothetical protein
MHAYLYTWNPQRWQWPDFSAAVARVRAGEPLVRSWGCGLRVAIEPGAPFLLMRVAHEPRGILAAGTVLSAPRREPHWDAELAARGRWTHVTDLRFTLLSDLPLVPLCRLQAHFPAYNWTPHASGAALPAAIAAPVLQAALAVSVADPPLR